MLEAMTTLTAETIMAHAAEAGSTEERVLPGKSNSRAPWRPDGAWESWLVAVSLPCDAERNRVRVRTGSTGKEKRIRAASNLYSKHRSGTELFSVIFLQFKSFCKFH